MRSMVECCPVLCFGSPSGHLYILLLCLYSSRHLRNCRGRAEDMTWLLPNGLALREQVIVNCAGLNCSRRQLLVLLFRLREGGFARPSSLEATPSLAPVSAIQRRPFRTVSHRNHAPGDASLANLLSRSGRLVECKIACSDQAGH
jgi:hypothetical protein